MARTRGKDSPERSKGPHGKVRPREVFVFTEGKVTEPQFFRYVHKHGKREPGREVTYFLENATAPSADRKPLTLVEAAIAKIRPVERAARKAGLRKGDDDGKGRDWNWPQVWCLFDRDSHEDIPRAFADAHRAGVQVAFSHPCFELWRLLHYQNYTGRFGEERCGGAAERLRGQQGFAQTYGPTIKTVSRELAKHVMPGQIEGRYERARRFAQRLNEQHSHPDQTHWDPYTDVWRFIEDGLLVTSY
ncbi:RloB family protein [Streptomyces sp. NBC_01304]|uniref:RloB family protein n=1 Tax=Streptomyces sp. NBC_01304 TaxID=2903818 RepID=UPI002E12F22A|nr:RloB family protein [Streptomyces sp. NBC_01304]